MPVSLRQMIVPCMVTGHVLVVALLYLHFGFNTAGEGDKYYTDALELSQGHVTQALDYQWLYSTYIIYLAFWIKFGISPRVIICISYLLSIGAYILFYRLLKREINPRVALFWLGFMMLSPMMQYWNLSLFSEPFFIALSLYCLYVWLYPVHGRISWLMLLTALLLLVTRPSGLFVVLGTVILWLLKHKHVSLRRLMYASVCFLGLVFILVFFFMPLHFQGYVADISSGAVYAGFPQYPLRLYPEAGYTLFDCYSQLIHEAGAGAASILVIEKCLSFFNLYRAYYSDFHNLFNVFHAVFYVFGVYALLKGSYPGNTSLAAVLRFCMAIVCLNMLLTGLFFNEWSERYTVSVFPFIFVCAAIGLHALLTPKQQSLAV
ncbi:MAG: hypothetical protein JST26_02560 [Bacteroidetes bacterium]|nr:hypothetical protein [Bacteroidota bacterium]